MATASDSVFKVFQIDIPLVRHPFYWEIIPPELEAGFEQLGNLDREWVWVLGGPGCIRGVLLACPCHGAAFIWRVALLPDAGRAEIFSLLRGFLKEMRERKVQGIITILDPKVETQAKFKSILERIKGETFGTYELVVAKTPEEFV